MILKFSGAFGIPWDLAWSVRFFLRALFNPGREQAFGSDYQRLGCAFRKGLYPFAKRKYSLEGLDDVFEEKSRITTFQAHHLLHTHSLIVWWVNHSILTLSRCGGSRILAWVGHDFDDQLSMVGGSSKRSLISSDVCDPQAGLLGFW